MTCDISGSEPSNLRTFEVRREPSASAAPALRQPPSLPQHAVANPEPPMPMPRPNLEHTSDALVEGDVGFDRELLLPYRMVGGGRDYGLPIDLKAAKDEGVVHAGFLDGSRVDISSILSLDAAALLLEGGRGVHQTLGDMWCGQHVVSKNMVSISPKGWPCAASNHHRTDEAGVEDQDISIRGARE